MLTFRGVTKELVSASVAVAIMAVIGPVNARAIDKIVSNANAVFTKAGGKKKEGMTQQQFQAAENQINDALDRLARAGVIGADAPPPLVLKRDLSMQEIISDAEFVQYFRGLASERDLQLRREMVDQAIAQQGAAQAAAQAAWEAALERWAAERDDRDRHEANREERRIRRENEELEMRNQELMWYLQHPRQPLPTPNNKPASTQQAQNGTNSGGSTGGLTGGPIGAGRPYNGQRIGPMTRPLGVPDASNGQRLSPSASPGPSGRSPPKADKGTSRDDKNSSKDDKKKSDDKSKK
jgi:hypothetical protein